MATCYEKSAAVETNGEVGVFDTTLSSDRGPLTNGYAPWGASSWR